MLTVTVSKTSKFAINSFTLYTFNRKTLMRLKVVRLLYKLRSFNRQLISARKHLMRCDGITVGLRVHWRLCQ